MLLLLLSSAWTKASTHQCTSSSAFSQHQRPAIPSSSYPRCSSISFLWPGQSPSTVVPSKCSSSLVLLWPIVLGVMGYDRYAAICHPLHYPILMSWQMCGKLGALCGIGGFLASLTVVYLVFSLPFCSANKVNHYFCDISPVIRLACTNTDAHEFVIFICGVLVLVVPFLFICVSYICILRTILKIPSAEGRRKAFSTCASHLTVVIIHYGCASYIYLRPTANYVSNKDRLVTVTYTIVTPLLNPMVYSLRNKDVQVAIRKVLGKKGSLKLYDWYIVIFQIL